MGCIRKQALRIEPETTRNDRLVVALPPCLESQSNPSQTRKCDHRLSCHRIACDLARGCIDCGVRLLRPVCEPLVAQIRRRGDDYGVGLAPLWL